MNTSENKYKYYIHTVPYLAELTARKERLYKVIDSIYKQNEIEYNKSAKNSEYYNHPLGIDGSIKRQIYYNKVIGILSSASSNENYIDMLMEALKKEFPYAYNAVSVKKTTKLRMYMAALVKKYGEDNLSENDINDNMFMFWIFSYYLGHEIDNTDEQLISFAECYDERFRFMNLIKKDNHIRIDKDELKVIESRYKVMKNRLNFTTTPYMYVRVSEDSEKDKKAYYFRYAMSLLKIYNQQKLDLDNIVEKLLTKKEIIELMYLCYCSNKEDFYDDEKLILWLIGAGQITYLIKVYNEAKNFISENNNEDLLNELEIVKGEYNETKSQLAISESKKEIAIAESNRLQKENERLKLELDELKNVKMEVASLRNYVFSQKNKEETKDDGVNINKMIDYLNGVRGIIVGGNPTWSNKIKELINWVHIPAEALSFDERILQDKTVVINTDYMSHSLYYKIISNTNKTKGLKFISNTTNMDKTIKEIYEVIN